MSLEAIIEALSARLQTLGAMGHLYHYQRVLPVEDSVQEVFCIEDETSPRGWSIRSWQWYRNGLEERRLDLSGDIVQVTHNLFLRGYWEQNDDWQSEVAFRGLVDAITALLRDPMAIDPLAVLTSPAQAIEETRVMFGSEQFMCHHARLSVMAREIVDKTGGGNWVDFESGDM